MTTRDWVVITGASSGIGKAFAKVFAQNGVNLVLTARNGVQLTAIANEYEHEYGVKTLIYAGDLSTQEGILGLISAAEQAKIRVRYLVNNAGFGLFGAFTDTAWKVEKNMLEVNVAAVTYLTKVFIKLMKKRGQGHILNVASTAAFYPGPNMAVYHASKAYVLHFSEAVNYELRGSGITVTTLCPGPTATKFAATARAHKTKLFTQNLSSAEQVALYGYRAMLKGKPVAIYGLRNRLTVWLLHLLPRQLRVKMFAHNQG